MLPQYTHTLEKEEEDARKVPILELNIDFLPFSFSLANSLTLKN